LQSIVSFAEQYHCAVIGITHFGKGSMGRAPQDRVIGSQAFAALARMVLVAAKEEGSSRRVLAKAKSNIAPEDGGVAYSIEQRIVKKGISGSYAIWEEPIEGSAREILGAVEDDEDSDAGSRQELGQLLLDTLQHAGGKMATKQLKAEVNDAGHSWEYAKKLKKSLGIEAEKQNMVGPWMWRLTGNSSAEKRQQRQKTNSGPSELAPQASSSRLATNATTSAANIADETEVMEVL
jgi:putative DNA primase/helicase